MLIDHVIDRILRLGGSKYQHFWVILKCSDPAFDISRAVLDGLQLNARYPAKVGCAHLGHKLLLVIRNLG